MHNMNFSYRDIPIPLEDAGFQQIEKGLAPRH